MTEPKVYLAVSGAFLEQRLKPAEYAVIVWTLFQSSEGVQDADSTLSSILQELALDAEAFHPSNTFDNEPFGICEETLRERASGLRDRLHRHMQEHDYTTDLYQPLDGDPEA